MKYKAILYDMDGVVNVQPEYFSRHYAKESGVDAGKLETFFDNEFLQTSLGKADLKQLIAKRNDLWQWQGTSEELMELWFAYENHPDPVLVSLIREQKTKGIKIYLATIQEKYRAAYIRNVMFPDLFDDMFVSCELGKHKTELAFFEAILKQLSDNIPGIQPNEVVYFDDNQEGLITAAQLGIDTYLYEGIKQVERVVN